VEAEDDEDVVMLWMLYFARCQNRGGQMSWLLLMHKTSREPCRAKVGNTMAGVTSVEEHAI
jgi:hypothetical protein